jgi:ribokinase
MRTTGFDLGVLPKRNLPTIHNRVYYDNEGGRRWEMSSTPEQFDLLSPRPKDLPENYLNAKAFLISAMSLEAQEELVSWLNKHTKSIIALDPQEGYVVGNERRLKSMISGIEIFLPSEVEVKMMLGHQNWPVAARELAAMGPQIVVIKRGEKGVLVYDRENDMYFQQSPIPGEVVDTTGAGDAFCGGFMAAYVHDPQDLPKAARAGSISASFAISSFGMTTLLEAKLVDGLRLLKELT